MAVDVDALKEYVGADSADGTDYEATLATAVALVENHVGQGSEVPGDVLDQAVLEVGMKLSNRRQSPTADFDGPIASAPKDPMITVYALLAPFIPAGFA